MAELVEVFRSTRVQDAQLVRAALEAHGVVAHVLGEHLAGMVPLGRRFLPVRVMVAEAHEAEARTVIEVMNAMADEPPDADEPTQCPKCNAAWEPGFDVCWSCQEPL